RFRYSFCLSHFPYTTLFRSCSYMNTTWEWAEAIDDDLKIATFKRIETPPSGVQPIASQPQLAAIRKKKKSKLLTEKTQEQSENISEEHTSELQSRENIVCRL